MAAKAISCHYSTSTRLTVARATEAQKHTDQQMKESDERLGILTRMMDEFIRRDRSKSP